MYQYLEKKKVVILGLGVSGLKFHILKFSKDKQNWIYDDTGKLNIFEDIVRGLQC